ncbi:MAG: DUF192 domain-containing protein [Treponema sp.]|nr:DUF192 domain-containing protein [Treponema sp.]
MKQKFVCIAILLLFSSLVSCGTKKLPVKTLSIRTASGATVAVQAEIAEKSEERARGFMERKNIPDGTGMLFVFEKDQILSFWMKNTPTPLSIAFIDHGGKIRDIFDMKPYSLANTVSTVSVRYALEVPQGWFQRAGISVGDTLILE